MVRARTEKGDAGSVLSGRAERGTAETNRRSVRGHVGALPAEHRAVDSEVPDRLRQVPHLAARQCGGGRSAASGVVSARGNGKGTDQGEAVVAFESMEEPGEEETRGIEPAVSVKPAPVES